MFHSFIQKGLLQSVSSIKGWCLMFVFVFLVLVFSKKNYISFSAVNNKRMKHGKPFQLNKLFSSNLMMLLWTGFKLQEQTGSNKTSTWKKDRLHRGTTDWVSSLYSGTFVKRMRGPLEPAGVLRKHFLHVSPKERFSF